MKPASAQVFAFAIVSIALAGACRRGDSSAQENAATKPSVMAEVHDDADEARKGSTAPAASRTETEKIEALIAALAELKDATFIRNGEPHDVEAAVEHMRRKWAWKKREIHTAEDFIRIAATGSSVSGDRYLIRFADGREVASADWFRQRLAEIEQGG